MAEKAHAEIETLSVTLSVADGTSMPAYVARPTTGPVRAGLLVFQEAFGVNAHIRDVTDRFAREGYAAIAPALFHRTDPNFEGTYGDFAPVMPHMQAITEDGLAADIRAAYDWITDGSGSPVSAVGAIGYCLGGRVAFLADAVVPVHAAVSYYGGGIAPNPRAPQGLLHRVPELQAPLLLFWGGKDTHLPAEQTRQIDDALTEAGKAHTTVTFSEADHGFFCDVRASYNPHAAHQAWALTLAFFADHLPHS